MKKSLVGLFVVCALCLCAGFALADFATTVAQAAASVFSADFSSGTNTSVFADHWTDGDGTVLRVDEGYGGSNGSLCIANKTENHTQAAGKIDVKKDVVYRVSVYIKTENLQTGAASANGAYLYFGKDTVDATYDSVRIGLSTSDDTAMNYGSTQWTKYEGIYIGALDGKEDFGVRVWGASGTAWFDDVVVEESENEPHELSAGTFAAASDLLNYWNYFWCGNTTYNTHEFSALSHTNDGTGSIKLCNEEYPNSLNVQYVGQRVQLKQDALYEVSGWIKTEDLTVYNKGAGTGAFFSFGDEYIVRVGISADGSLDWTYVHGEFTAPVSGAYIVSMRLWGASGTAWFDDVQIKKLADIDPVMEASWIDTVEPMKGSYTMAALPDTQMLSAHFPNYYLDTCTWLANHADELNLQMVMHLGDITDNSYDEAQWELAVESMRILSDAGIPYSLVPGNHDYEGYVNGSYASNSYVRSLNAYNKYFPFNDYFGPNKKIYDNSAGYFEEGRMENTYHIFSVGGIEYVVFALEFAPRNAVLDWVGELCERYSQSRVIITTHAYINGSAVYSEGAQGKIADQNGGQAIWDKLVNNHSNILMVLNGHHTVYGLNYRIDNSQYGNSVVQMIANAQDMFSGSEAMILLMSFSDDGNTVQFYYYNVERDKYYFDSNFTLELNLAPKDTLAGISVKEKTELTVGASETLAVTYLPEKNLGSKTVTWASSNEKVVTVDENGKVTAVGKGKAEVTATSVCGFVATCNVVVPSMAESITVAKTYYRLGETAPFELSVLPATCTEKFTYTGYDDRVLTISSEGVVTPVSVGETTVTVTAEQSGVKTMRKIYVVVPYEKITLEGTTTLENGATSKLTATLSGEGATEPNTVTWESSHPSVVSVSADGTLTAVGIGTARITASSPSGYAKTYKIVTVTGDTDIFVQVTAQDIVLQKGDTGRILLSVSPGDSDPELSYLSLTPNVATVDENGTVTALRAGVGYIDVVCNKTICRIQVTVTENGEASVAKEIVMTERTLQLPVKLTDASYITDNEGIVTVENGIVTALKNGEVTVSVTDGTTTETYVITVNIPVTKNYTRVIVPCIVCGVVLLGAVGVVLVLKLRGKSHENKID